MTGNGTGGIDRNTITPLVATLKQTGIQSWGWINLHGDYSKPRTDFAIQITRELAFDGLVIGAGEEFESPGTASLAKNYLKFLRAELPRTPLALSAFSLPSFHPHFPWQEFLAAVDLNMPSLDWTGEGRFSAHLERCLREFHSLSPHRAVVPTVKFNGKSGYSKLASLQMVLDISQEMNLKAINLWEKGQAGTDFHGASLGLKSRFHGQQHAQSRDFLDHYFAALNSANFSEIINFYGPRCALVTAHQTYVGRDRIMSYYQNLLSKRLPGAFFDMTSSAGTGSSRNVRWRARTRPDIFKKSLKSATPKPFNRFTDEHKIFKGVYFKRQAINTPRYHVVHVACIDLDEPGIGLVVTPHDGLGKTASNFLDTYNVQLAINGDEWLSWRNPKGLAVSEGIVYSAASNEPTIYISPENKVQFGGDPPVSIWNAISGSHTLVRAGQMSSKLRRCSNPEVYCGYRAPRTSVGITADNKLLLIVVQGPNNALRNALTLKELAELNLQFGAVEAINMDGGGSSTIAVDNYGIPQVLNAPSDGSERVVSNHLGVVARFLDPGNGLIVDDGNDTIGLLDGKIVHHYTSFSIKTPQAKIAGAR